MDTKSKNGELKEFKIMHEFHNIRKYELTVHPENSNLLGFRGNEMVFEELVPDKDKSEGLTKSELESENDVSKVQMKDNNKKFLVLNGKKFHIIKPNNSLLKGTLTSKANNSIEPKPNRKILPKIPCNTQNMHMKNVKPAIKSTSTEKCMSVIVNSVNAKHNLFSAPTSVIKVNPDLYINDVKTNMKSEIFKIDGHTYEIQGNHIKAANKIVTDLKKNVLNNSPNVQIESKVEVAGPFKIVGSANHLDPQLIPISSDYRLNRMSESDNSQFKILTNLLFVPNKMETNGLTNNCNCNLNKKSLVTTSTNTEGETVVSRGSQTEEPFDLLLDSLWSQCLRAENAESLITGKNVNMGTGPCSISVENKVPTKGENAKYQFFLDLQNCLMWDSGNLPIHKAVIQKDMAVVKKQCVLLKARSTGVNIVNNNNLTPLQLAVMQNVSIEIVRVLLLYAADMSILDPEGNNVLHLAVQNHRNDLVELFLDNMKNASMNIDQFNYEGLTPLMLCAFHIDRIDMAENLLKKGANPNLRDLKSGRTVMFHAAENHNIPIVSLLLDYSADTRIRNFFGTSVHDAMFELDDIPKEIKYPILGRDLKLHQRRKLNHHQDGKKQTDQLKRRKLQIVPTYQKIMSNTKFIVNTGNIKH